MDYRKLYADFFAVVFNQNGVRLDLGTSVDDKNQDLDASVYLSPISAKMLGIMLTSAVEGYENSVGEIPIPPGEAERLRSMFVKPKVQN